MSSRIVCSHCGQDWIEKYRVKESGEVFWACPDCESLWLESQKKEEETDLYISEFLESRGITWPSVEKVD
ncbi:hypothetical protein [Streptomyces bikiniensis]|uniref:hypothetical protein n=1 Tax=Streptomyces bikiniensis TaxID=1896 RepID=UPI000525E41D|nr:hypothetical protein [Streptomyces bikiniensis]